MIQGLSSHDLPEISQRQCELSKQQNACISHSIIQTFSEVIDIIHRKRDTKKKMGGVYGGVDCGQNCICLQQSGKHEMDMAGGNESEFMLSPQLIS